MCGELDDNESESRLEERLYARFMAHAAMLLQPDATVAGSPAADTAAYMEKLFRDALDRGVRDAEAARPNGYDRISAQVVVFARLAGLVAGHLSLGEDPLRKAMEALMLGYGEAEAMDQSHSHDHHHGDVYVSDHHH
jgi:hypothetical protein